MDSGGGGGGGNTNNPSAGNTNVGMGGGIIIGPSSDCGNGRLDTNEQCDDGNKNGGDGCSKSCQEEADFKCETPGQPCKSTAACGNGILTSSETCDDGNTNPGDGCSADCKSVDDGWACRVPGKACIPNCGDGKLTATEACDDSNTMNGDGCSSTCLVEPGWSCDKATGKCTKSVCGNGMVEAGESCDKGMADNGRFFGDGSGCSKTCTQEPTCRDSTGVTIACTTRCGDSNVDPGEKCDDGNQVDGDGCSSKCQEEGGFTCSTVTKEDTSTCTTGGGKCLSLPITYRDFDGANLSTGHPDFFFYGGTTICVPNASGVNPAAGPGLNGTCPANDSTALCSGLVKSALGSDGKPVVAKPGMSTCACRFTDWDTTGLLNTAGTSCTDSGGNPRKTLSTTVSVIKDETSFKQWYSDSDKSTKTVSTLELAQVGATNQYQFSSSNGRTVYDDLHEIFMGTGATSLASGFFPLEASTRPKVCNLWPYWLTNAACVAKDGSTPSQQWDPRGSYAAMMAGTGGPVKPVTGMMRNFYFTSEVRYLFRFAGGETLQFFGDDDVWVFINGHLALDLGAPHERLKGTVTLNATGGATVVVSAQDVATGTDIPVTGVPAPGSLGLEVGKTYEIAIFHADRHPRESNYQLTLSGYGTSTSQCMARCGDGVATAGEECDAGDKNNDTEYGGCTTQCKFGPFCGDNIKNGDEECDKGKENGAVYGTAGGCTLGCKNAHFCGDGIVDAANGEECDTGSANSATSSCTDMCKYIPK
jgi:fibro-slime domain-containing protein